MKLILADGREHQLLAGVLTLGRDDSCDVVITDSLISRRHVEIHTDTQGSVIVDLGSRNGTFVNGQRIAARQPRPLRAGDQIQLGRNVQMTVQGTAARDIPTLAADMPPTGAPTMDLPPPAPAATPFWKSRLMLGFALAVAVLIALGRFLFGNGGEEAASMLPATATLPAARTATLIEMPVITASLKPLPATPTVEARSTVSPTPTPASATATSSMTTLPSPTETSSVTATPTPIPISVTNAAKATQLGMLGKGTINQMAVSPDEQLLAVASSIGVYLYDYETLDEIWFMEMKMPLYSITFSPDGKMLATGNCSRMDRRALSCIAGEVALWDTHEGRELRTMTGHTRAVNRVTFSTDGTILVSEGNDGTKWWDASSGRELPAQDRGQLEWSEATSEHEMPAPKGHTNPVYQMAFSPDGATLVTVNEFETISLWDIGKGQELYTLTGYGSIYSIAFSPNGQILAATGSEDIIWLWDTPSGQELHTLMGHTSQINDIAFSPDGTIVASGADDKTVRVWDVDSGQELRVLTNHTSAVKAVAFNPEGTILASVGDHFDSTTRLWDVESGQMIRELPVRMMVVSDVFFSPDGATIAVMGGRREESVRLWDVASGQELCTINLGMMIRRAAIFNLDGTILASGDDNGVVKLWDVTNGQEIRAMVGHANVVEYVAFSPDGTILASKSADNSVKLWEVASGRELCTLTGHTRWGGDVAFSPDGTILASASLDGTIRFWGVASGATRSGTPVSEITPAPVAPSSISVDNATNVMQLAVRESKCIQDIAISPDGRFVATAGAANYRGVYLYDRVTLNELRFMKTSGAVASVAFSPDGLILAAAGCIRSDEDGTIWLFDVSTGQQLGTLTGHTEPAVGVAFSPDGTMLASSSWDKTVRLWDVRTAQELRVLTGHTSSVYDVKFSPDGMLLATAGGVSDTTVRIWNVHNGQIQHILAGHESAVYSVAFSPDGTLLVSGGDDKVRLWDIATARELRTLAPWDFVREHDTRLRGLYTKSVYSLAFNPEGTIVAVGSGIHDVLLWDVTTGQVLHSLIGHESEVMGVAFSSDGTVLVTGNCRLSDSMRLWGITAEDEREGTVHPTTSPVPAASSSPTPPLTSTSPSLLYQDNFADTVQWHRGVGITTAEERFVEAHEYHIIVKTAPHLAWDYHQAARIADFKAEVDARVIQEPTGGDGDYEYGMIFRFVDADNFLCFVVRRDGAVQIAEQTNSRWQVIQDWRRNSAVRAAPDTNHFEVIGNGADVAIYANQQHITTFSTDNESTGYIGVLVGAFDQRPNIQVAFKELAVWTLTAKPDIPKPVATTTRQAGVKPPPPTALANLGVVVKNWLGQDAVIIGGEGKNEQNQALTMPEQHIPPNAEIVMQLHPGHYNWYANTGSPQCERCAFMGEIDVYAGQMTKIQLYIDDNKVLQGVVE